MTIFPGAHDLTQKDKEVTLAATYKTHPDYTLNRLQGFLVNEKGNKKKEKEIRWERKVKCQRKTIFKSIGEINLVVPFGMTIRRH